MSSEAAAQNPIEAAALAQRVVANMSEAAWRARRIHLALHKDPVQAWATVSAQHLEQILVNLVHIAIQWELPGGVILIDIESQPEAVIIRLHGSAGEICPVNRRVKALVKKANASLLVESAPGKGSCFTLKLPPAISDGVRHTCCGKVYE
ncbi:MAG: hypothetical protein AB1894_00880 [Chloroflexota bacterium]